LLEAIRECWERGVCFHDYGGGPLHSIQHTEEDVDRLLNVLDDLLGEMADELR